MDIVTLALAKKFAQTLVVSAGLDLADVSISGTTITFTFSDSTTAQMTFPTPADGVSVTALNIDANKHLIVTFSDGTTSDAGAVPLPDMTNYYTKSQVDSAIESAIGGALNGSY